MILGLDISTSKIGYAIVDKDENLVLSKFLKFKSDVPLEQRAKAFEERMLNLMVKYDIQQIFVEQPFMAFSGGKTTAVTMSKLQRFNGMCCYGIYSVFGHSPTLIQANKARGLVGIKVRRGQKAKPVVLEWVEENYEEDFTYEMTKYGNPRPATYDMADAIVVARAGIELLNEESS